ncbi:SGNH hydrolase-type esterase domain-containing protein [Microdochium trichocladiopsis]|uniref:SGNH hydrolase-type esterase domain-containing protein n=1 Tax=Microdochium trichocladiopsis TaxID=1682393 RepID=A0A9P8YKY1_9PEZI|nr:SGNH hydrolase-type esterase domain-containing protein [Microdochium trichocladiopsis]KAH7040900.1 SGNH hydrolase-type esterase domain-containing protein [Microdochium trichocladiopsis]
MLSQTALSLLAWSSVLSLGSSYILPHGAGKQVLDTLMKRATDPTELDWVKNVLVVGDSYTAAIGAGTPLGGFPTNDWSCARYDQGYPTVLKDKIGPSIKKFVYKACSGDRSEGIYKQVTDVTDSDFNLALLTAGGNDLCLAGMIKACVLVPFDGDAVCDTVIKKAEENIKTILKPNIKSILLKLNDRMAKDSVVVMLGYAQFFNTDNEDVCTKNQDWTQAIPFMNFWGKKGIPLDIALRKRLNNLVIGINDATKEVIRDVRDNGNVKYKLKYADWDKWAYQVVRGQYCDPQGDGTYPDAKQPDLHFFKPDTKIPPWQSELRKRAMDAYNETSMEEVHAHIIYDSILYNSPDPRAAALHALDPRDAPSPPGCPGDGTIASKLSLPDVWAKWFHPNEKGHMTMASFAMDAIVKGRAEVLGQGETCNIRKDEFKCWSADGSRGYVHPKVMDGNFRDFCSTLDAPKNEINWKRSKTYQTGTPDEATVSLELDNGVGSFDKELCLNSFNKIVNGCDEKTADNPMIWKSGGKWVRGDYTYRIDVKRSNRKWPYYKEPIGDCRSEYKFVLNSIFIHGGGWATADFGQDTLKKRAGACIGSTPTSWKFWYYDQPDKDGYEWAASFNTPVFTRSRCFDNDKVPNESGGHVGGCGGTG